MALNRLPRQRSVRSFAKIGGWVAVSRIVEHARFTQCPATVRGAPVDSVAILAATAGAFLLAGLVKGAIGLGLPTVAIGLLGLMMTPAQAAAIMVAPALITNVWQAAVGGSLLPLIRRIWPMLAGICIGTFIAAAWLPSGNSGQATLWLGLALVIYAGLGLIKMDFAVSPRAERWLNLPVGALTGAITAATGIYVLPGTPYLHALRFDRHELVQGLGISFTVSTVMLGAALMHTGEMGMSLAAPVAVAIVASLVGMRLGQLVRGKVREQTFRLWFFIGLLGLGGHLALRGLL
jgi:uncharacterized membrane protein YfcA